jgi:extracellular elastinolytic metalloproteinase
MRSSALIALLPFLATASVQARPHNHHHTHHRDHSSANVRKSLSFGPAHPHATFEVIHHDREEVVGVEVNGLGEVDVMQAARDFLDDRAKALEGEGY